MSDDDEGTRDNTLQELTDDFIRERNDRAAEKRNPLKELTGKVLQMNPNEESPKEAQ